MISILYPNGDYESADIAIKAQSLSQSSKIYIVPKHYGRNEEAVYKNLDKTKIAIFIVYDKVPIDDKTQKELKYLKKKGTPIYSIIPADKHFGLINDVSTVQLKYRPNDKNHILDQIENIRKELEKDANSAIKSSNNEIIGAITIFILVIILIAIIGTSQKKKYA